MCLRVRRGHPFALPRECYVAAIRLSAHHSPPLLRMSRGDPFMSTVKYSLSLFGCSHLH